MADPWSSNFSLLTKLAAQQRIYHLCHASPKIPTAAKKSLTILLAAYEELESQNLIHVYRKEKELGAALSASIVKRFSRMEALIFNSRSENFRNKRIMEVQKAAKTLSDTRTNGLGKILIGTINYIVALGLAFTHTILGNFNNRTGHSIAFAVLWSWLIVSVFQSSLVGGFITKRVARRELERLQINLDRIELDESKQRPKVNKPKRFRQQSRYHAKEVDAPSNNSRKHPLPCLRKEIFDFQDIDEDNFKQVYRSLMWSGSNYSLTPSPLCDGKERFVLGCVSLLPIAISTAAAFWISTTNPTSGVSCRSIQQLCFFCAWITSAGITVFLRRRFPRETQFQWTRGKDLVFCLALGTSFAFGFIGWFNSCYCWSARMSLRAKAYIVVNPGEIIEQLAKTTWPAITLTVVGFHLLFNSLVFWHYREGAQLYFMSDKEHETWQTPLMRKPRRSRAFAIHRQASTDNFSFSGF